MIKKEEYFFDIRKFNFSFEKKVNTAIYHALKGVKLKGIKKEERSAF